MNSLNVYIGIGRAKHRPADVPFPSSSTAARPAGRPDHVELFLP